jgi:hypothetical protein
MYKKLIIITGISISLLQAYDHNIASVFHNCQTIVEAMQDGDINNIKELLQEQEMREAFLLSIIAAQKK